jgi:hypothetical protein
MERLRDVPVKLGSIPFTRGAFLPMLVPAAQEIVLGFPRPRLPFWLVSAEQRVDNVPSSLDAQDTAETDKFALRVDLIGILLPAVVDAIALPAEPAWAEVDLFGAQVWEKFCLVFSADDTKVILSPRQL